MTAPTSIRGYVDDTLFDSILADALEFVPDLTWPLSVRTYSQMRRDAQLAAVQAGYTLQLRRASWQLDGRGCRPEVVSLVADDFGLPVAGDDEPGPARLRGVSWAEHLRAALLKLTYGFSGFEMQADVSSGQARLVGLWERPAHTIAQIHVDPKSGQFLGVTQDLAGGNWDVPQIRADRMAWYCHDREGASWQGVSLLRPAYGAWLIKREMQRVLATSNRRFGMGVPTVEWAATANPTPAQHADAQRAASAARVGDQSGLALPPGAHLVLTGLTGGTPDTLAFLKWLDQQMSRQALMGYLDLGETSNGSRALGETFVDVLMMALESIGEQVADVATRQVAARLVEWNWGPDEPVPRVTVSGIGSKREVTAESLQLLLSSGALSADPALEAWVRREYRLPEQEQPATAPKPAPSRRSPSSDGGTDTEPAQPATVAAAASKSRRGRHPEVDGQLALPVAAAAAREPTAVEQQSGVDHDALAEDLDQAEQDLAEQWPELAAPLIAAIVTAVAAAVAAGTLAELGSLAVPDDVARRIALRITAAMTTLARVSAKRAAGELVSQGLTIKPGTANADRLAEVAQATARVIAAGYANGAARTALAAAGPNADADTVAAAVRADLQAMSEAGDRGWVATNLSSALATAQAAGRMATFEAAPDDVAFYASEANDTDACGPCKDIDGTRFDSLDDAIEAYPAGKYVECLGRDRCRGELIAVVEQVKASQWKG